MFIPSNLRSPLVYPAGRRPGFDPSHVAADGCILSCIASANGGSISNVLNSALPSIVGTAPTPAILGPLGPSAGSLTSGSYMSVPIPALTLTTATIGAIFLFLGTPGNAIACNATGGFTGVTMRASWNPLINNTTVIPPGNFPSQTTGVPYFYAFSFLGGSVVNAVLTILSNGRIYSNATSTAIANSGLGGTAFGVGNTPAGPAGRQSNGYTAAAMMNTSFMSLPQLIQWAQHPWDFWYPVTK